MAIYIQPKWRKYLPHLEIYISVPLIKVQTMIFTDNQGMLAFTYLGLSWQIHKWQGNIRLFEVDKNFKPFQLEEDAVKTRRCGCWYSRQYALRHYCDKHKNHGTL